MLIGYALRLAGLTLSYVVIAWPGLQVAFVHGAVSPVWLPTGLAVAALTLWGLHWWPAIAVGAFLANLLFASHWAPVAAGIAVGNTLEALLGAWVLRRQGVKGEVRRVRDALVLLAVALLAPLPAATGGVLSLSLAGFSAWEQYSWAWLLWWLGDCMGALIVLPLLLAWAGERSPVAYPVRAVEFAGVLALTVALVSFAYLRDDALTPLGMPPLPPSAFLIPPVAWAALRFRPAQAMLVLALACALAVAYALTGTSGETIGPLLWLQMMLLSVGGGALVMLGAIADRAQADQARQEERKELAQALAAAGSGTFIWHVPSNTSRWSDELLALYGLRREEFGGRIEDWLDCVLPEDRDAGRAAIERSFMTGEIAIDFRIRRRDTGEIRWMVSQAKVDFDTAGKPVRMIGVNTDITERKRSEAQLWESEARFRLMADAAPVLIWVAALDLGCTWFNRPWLTFTGRTLDHELGQGWAEGVHPEDLARCLAVYKGAFEQRETFSMEYRLRRHDGEYRWLLDRGLPHFETSGGFAGYIGCAIDITEHKQAQADLEQSHRQLAAILESLAEGVITFDLAGNILNMNHHARELLGLDPGGPVRHPWHEYADVLEFRAFGHAGPASAALPVNDWPITRVLRGETFTNFEVELRHRSAEKARIVSYSGTPVRGADGHPFLGVLTLRDISERKQAEQALQASHDQLTLALTAGLSGTFRWDAETDHCHWSDELLALYGLDAFGGRYEDWIACVLPEDQAAAKEALQRAVQQGQIEHLFRIRRRDNGEVRWLHGRARLQFDAAGRSRQMIGVQMDITAHRQAEEQIRQQAMLLDLTPDPTFVWEEHGGIRFWNRGCEQLYGYTAAEALGRSPQILLKTVFPVSLAACRAELDQTGRWGGELRHSTRDGRLLIIESGMRQLVIDGKIVLLEANRDITARKLAEAEVRRLNAELEERVQIRTADLARSNEALLKSNEELQRFAYIASHDLQTPLRSVVGFAQLLQKEWGGRLEGDAADWLRRVVDASRHMHCLVRDLLAYSRVDSQARPFEAVDLDRVVQGVLDTLKETIQETGAAVTLEPLPTVPGDPVQLTQLVQNLVENAIKYRGATAPQVRIGAERQGRAWVISVRDNGIGIDARHREAIFELFRRLHTTQAYPGTGIGLAICRRVAERHGGRIWVESEAGQGSVFQFSLPVPPEDSVHESESSRPASRSAAGR